MAFRHPTEQKDEISPPSPSPISLGKSEKKILQHLNSSKERLNIKGFSRSSGIPRSSVNDILNRLMGKKMVSKPSYGHYEITLLGKSALNVSEGGAGNFRTECRERDTLSQHFTRFSLPINSKLQFSESRLSELSPLKTRTLKLPNNIQHYAYFEDATIIIFKKQVIIRIHDLVGVNQEDIMLEAFTKAIEYAERLGVIGIKTESMELDMAHYARVQSHLAEFLKKIDERYFLDLGNGKKFWIDFSTGKVEDETNSEQARKRIDEFLSDAIKSKSLVSDIDKLKEVSGNLVKCIAMREIEEQSGNFQIALPKEQQTLPNYIG